MTRTSSMIKEANTMAEKRNEAILVRPFSLQRESLHPS